MIETACVWVFLPVLGIAIALAFVRLLRGPSLPDRVVALDLLMMLAMGVIGVYAIAYDERVLLGTAVALALIGFLSSVAFARYLERRAR